MLADRPSLQLHLQLDYFRSTRPGPENTAVTLSPLLRAYPDRVKISFYRSPTLRGLLAKIVPRRWDEGWGTWHAKIYGADDELLLTGYVDTVATFAGPHSFAARISIHPTSRTGKTDISTYGINLHSRTIVRTFCRLSRVPLTLCNLPLIRPKNTGSSHHPPH